MGITRDDIENDRIRQRLRQEAAEGRPHAMLSDEEFERTRAEILSQFDNEDELWVFGYGSLIWNPTFHFAESQLGWLPDHERQFCLWANTGRGDPDCPGLWLALDDGEGCAGVAFRLHNHQREYESLMLWRREMVSGAYRPVVLPVEIGGRPRPCICLLANKSHERYAGALSQQRIIEAIASAKGHLGTCCEYLFNTVEKLDSMQVHDEHLHQLAQAVRAYQLEHGIEH